MKRRAFITASTLGTVAASLPNRAQGAEEVNPLLNEADHLFALARRAHGKAYTEAELARVHQQIIRNRHAAARLANFSLRNADEPVLAPSNLYRLADFAFTEEDVAPATNAKGSNTS